MYQNLYSSTLKSLLGVFFVLTAFNINAQITLNFPLERSVFQRNNENIGFVAVSGTTPVVVDSIQARFTDLQKNEVHQNWTSIANQTDLGYFQDRIPLQGGWYKMDLRTWKDGRIDDFTSVQKVGVGEVFVIAGQSNAQGVRGNGAEGATSDLVNSVNYTNDNFDVNPPRTFSISQLADDSDIGPSGFTPWCWSVLGDKLVERYGVPVLFFNGAWRGTLSVNWLQSAQNIFSGSAVGETLPTGYPYKNLETSLSYFASMFGVRAVLWMQGETDTAPGIPNYQQYYDYIGFTIGQSRNDFGHNVPWVMARTSWVDGVTSDLVTRAQNDLINTPGFNVFEGPATDNLMIPRFDFVHFGNTSTVKGLDILGNAWNESLSDSFFQNSNPIQTNPFVQFRASCSFLRTDINLPQNTSPYHWSDGGGGSFRTGSSGIYSAIVKDANSNYKLTNTINLGLIPHEGAITATSDKTEFCAGDSVAIRAEEWTNVRWRNGATGQVIYVKESSSLNYEAFNSIGCRIGNSNIVSVNRLDPPVSSNEMSFTFNADDFVQNGETITLCQGDVLNITSDQQWQEYFWNDESSEQSISVNTNQNLSFRGRYADNCFSDLVPVINARFQTKPMASTISRASVLSIATNVTNASRFHWFLNNAFLETTTSPELRLGNSGDYQVSYDINTESGLTCTSELSPIFSIENLPNDPVFIYPNPIANNELVVELPDVVGTSKYEVLDITGRSILSRSIIEANNERVRSINFAPYASGVYFIRITTPETVVVKKVVKN